VQISFVPSHQYPTMNSVIAQSQSNIKSYSLAFVSSTPLFKIGGNLGPLDGILPISLLTKILMYAKNNLKCCLISTLIYLIKYLIIWVLKLIMVVESLMIRMLD
jgi:hypothetical protein